jgi:hypothetical protein
MKSGWRIVIVAAINFLTVAVTHGQSFPLLSAAPTNSSAQTYSTTDGSRWIGDEQMESYSNTMAPHDIYGASDSTNVLPVIEFEDVPLSVAIYNLARQDRINYLFDSQVHYRYPDSQGKIPIEPLVTKRWENVTATYAFMVICTNYGFIVIKDPATSVVFIRNKNHAVNFVTLDFYANDTNVIPLIVFQDVPLSRALKNLAKQARLKCIFSPRMDPWPSDSEEPQINARWENITASQAFAALCENYDLNVIKYPVSGIIRIEPAD